MSATASPEMMSYGTEDYALKQLSLGGRRALATRIQRIFEQAFRSSPRWSEEDVHRQLEASDHLTLVIDQAGVDVAYRFASGFDDRGPILVDGRRLVWEDAVAVIAPRQRDGIRRKLLLPPLLAKAAILGARSQNPAILASYYRLGRCFPFHDNYDTSDGRKTMDSLCAQADQVARSDRAGQLERRIGLVRNAYRGRLGDYPVNLGDQETARIERQLASWGLRREEGDAVVVTSFLTPGLSFR